LIISNENKFESSLNLSDDLSNDIYKFLKMLKDLSKNEIMEIQDSFENNTREIPFSKFSECLSPKLAKKTISERVLDLDAVLKLVKNSLVISIQK